MTLREFAWNILTVNGGSSSIKFAAFRTRPEFHRVFEGQVTGIGTKHAEFTFSGSAESDTDSHAVNARDHSEAAAWVINWITHRLPATEWNAVGHRVVHGGAKYVRQTVITPDVLKDLRELSPFDPEHLPAEIKLAEIFQASFSDVSHVACFDTAFHHDIPRAAQIVPIPRRYESKGIRRYGFHGLSYTYLMDELKHRGGERAALGRVVLAHLGNGASLAAVRDGRAADTSMGFTPTSGIPMSTRAGDLDPGLVWYLVRTENMSSERFNWMVNEESGLLGISETSSDMRDLLERESADERCAEAVAVFCYQVKRWIGGFAATLGGLDTLIFSGGIGEQSPVIRERVCDRLEFLGIQIDEARNRENAEVISSSSSTVTVRVIPTDEQVVMARMVAELLNRDKQVGRN